MDTYDWLLALHVSGAFLLLGGATAAAALNATAVRSERPREIALFLGLVRIAVVAVIAGAVLTLLFGLWLVSERDYSLGQVWIIISLLLWLAGMAAGGLGGKRDRETRELAEQLAAEGNVATAELRARLRDPGALALSWGSGVAFVVVLALMIWKPGA